MNTKVTQMIELLFRDVQESDEVQALREEVLNNCQDRFEDLIRGGLREEEALAAVMESLKGMEDVLKDYPRKEAASPEKDVRKETPIPEAQSEQPENAVFQPENVKAIHVQLTGCDLEVTTGGNEVLLEKQGAVHYGMETDGTLRIWQERVAANVFKGISWEESISSFEHFGDAMNRLAQNVSQLISGKIGEINGTQEARLTMRLPESFHPEVSIRTMGGDIRWIGPVPGSRFILGTTSGDMTVQIDRDTLVNEVEISSTSGDAELHMSAETVRVATVSGDISWDGDAGVLEMNSTSGDTEVKGRIRMASLKTTSGDLDLELEDDQTAEIKADTVSGDIHVRMAGSEVQARLKTVSGEIRTHGIDLVEEAPIQIEANTISGNLKISGEK